MVERYNYSRDFIAGCQCEMDPSSIGDYVSADDYDSLVARLAEYETLLAKAGSAFDEGAEVIASLRARLAEAERLLHKFHVSGPEGITELLDEVPAFLGIADSASAAQEVKP